MARPATGSSSPDALDLAPGIPPWEKQPGETAEAFHRFLQYLDVDPLLRSKNRMAAVHEALCDRDPGMCSVAALQNMASLNHWHIRAEAHDRHKRRQAELAAERAEQEWAETVARRRAEIRLKHMDAAAEIIQKGLYALAVKDPADISATDAIRMVDTGVRIEKETLGLNSKQNPAAQEAEHVNDLSDDQTAARLRQLADELARRINDQNKPTGNAAAAPDVMDAEVIPQGDSSDAHYSQPSAGPEPRPDTGGGGTLAIEAARPE